MNELREYVKRKFNLSDDDYRRLVDNEKQRIANPSFEYNGIDLGEAKEMKKKEMNFRCEQAIIKGFTASNGNEYRTNRDDQTNMIGQYNALVADSTITNVDWKTENNGYVSHTRDEWLSIYQEAFTHKQTQLFRYDQLKNNVDACTTISEVEAIVW